jgi:hypothetical protein
MQRGYNKLVSSMIAEDDNCFLPPLDGPVRSRVGIADLQVPSKAQREHKDGCAALRNSKIIEAEAHLRKRGLSSGRNPWLPRSCWAKCWKRSRKLTKLTVPVPNLWPLTPITCQLTFVWQIFPRTRRVWNKVLQLSTRALEIDPTNEAVAYDYNAAANFHLHRLPEAEKGALRVPKSTRATPTLACTSCWLKSMKRRVTDRVKLLNCGSI